MTHAKKNLPLQITTEEWAEAKEFFYQKAHKSTRSPRFSFFINKKNNPPEIKFQKKYTKGKKNSGHSFIKINDIICAVNNTHLEADLGAGGSARIKQGILEDGTKIAVRIETLAHFDKMRNHSDSQANAIAIDEILIENKYLLARAQRYKNKSDSGILKTDPSIPHYKTDVKVITILSYLGDRDLHTELYEKTEKKPTEKLMYALKMAQAVQKLHHLGIIHNDLKESNFVVNGTGKTLTINLIDFEFALKLTSSQNFYRPKDSAGRIIIRGSPKYMATESLLYGIYSYESDVHQLGHIFFNMGLPPEMNMLCKKMQAPNKQDRPSLSDVMTIILQALNKQKYNTHENVNKPFFLPSKLYPLQEATLEELATQFMPQTVPRKKLKPNQ